MAIEHDMDSPFALAVRMIGSQSATARIVKKSQSAVYKRLKSGKPVWAEAVMPLVEATGIDKSVLRPDLHPREALTARPSSGDIEIAR